MNNVFREKMKKIYKNVKVVSLFQIIQRGEEGR